MKSLHFALAIVSLCLIFSVGAKSQINLTAIIKGKVVSEDDRPIRYAEVSLLNLMTLETVTRRTNQFGYFNFNDLPFGDIYYITATAKNHKFPYRYSAIRLTVPVSEMTITSGR